MASTPSGKTSAGLMAAMSGLIAVANWMGPILAPGGAGVRGPAVGILAAVATVAVGGDGVAVWLAVTVGGGVAVGALAVGVGVDDLAVGLPGGELGLEVGDWGGRAEASPTTRFIIVAGGVAVLREGLSVPRVGAMVWPG